MQRILWKIIRAERNPPPPPKGLSLIFHYSKIVFESFGVHLSLIYKKRSEHKANGAKQGAFINNVSKDKEIVGGLFKRK